jgi:hypothetical protein
MPSGSLSVERFAPDEQHEPPALCFSDAEAFGSCALRSLMACALRCSAGIPSKAAPVMTKRGASLPQSGHGCGRLDLHRAHRLGDP